MSAEPRLRYGTSRENVAALVPRPWVDPPPEARRLAGGAQVSGSEWHDDVGHWCLLTHVTSGAPQASKVEQTRLMLERMSATLTGVGLAFGDVVRTWYFLDDILSWYSDFNHERTRFFEQHGLLERMPASTAVGLSVDRGSALVAALLAMRPRSERVTIHPVPSPAQGSAFDYGSSFSRATEVTWPGGKRLYVSGTASIDPAGRTVHSGRMHAQMRETFRIVAELLDSRGLCFDDVTRAVCYVARQEDAHVVAEHQPREISWVHATVCRSDLLFELELIAGRENG